MSRRLDGRNPLAYLGVKPSTPTQLVVNKRRPTSTDLQNFQLGTWWIIPYNDATPTQEVWILINKTATTATWIELDSGGGSVVPGAAYTLLTADGSGSYGSNVGPGTAGQLLLSGGASANPAFVTATAVSPLAVSSSASTFEYSISISDHALIVGDGASGVTEIAPSATAGVPLVSKGATADPAYDKAVVAGGGTGRATAVAYSVLCGGTTTTAAHQSVANVGNSGDVLTSQGAASIPQWGAPVGGGAITITEYNTPNASGNHVLASNTAMVEIIAWGAGSSGAGGHSSYGGAVANGGVGGGAGSFLQYKSPVAAFGGAGSSIAYHVAAITTGGAPGNVGAVGEQSSFGSVKTPYPGSVGAGNTGAFKDFPAMVSNGSLIDFSKTYDLSVTGNTYGSIVNTTDKGSYAPFYGYTTINPGGFTQEIISSHPSLPGMGGQGASHPTGTSTSQGGSVYSFDGTTLLVQGGVTPVSSNGVNGDDGGYSGGYITAGAGGSGSTLTNGTGGNGGWPGGDGGGAASATGNNAPGGTGGTGGGGRVIVIEYS